MKGYAAAVLFPKRKHFFPLGKFCFHFGKCSEQVYLFLADASQSGKMRVTKYMQRHKKKAFWDTVSGMRLARCFAKAAERPEKLPCFLDQLFTPKELGEISRRLTAAQYLFAGMSYKAINAYTGMSSKSIARISKKASYKNEGIFQVFADIRTDDRIIENQRKKDREARRNGYRPISEA